VDNCPSCGAEVEPEGRFCTKCGAAVGSSPSRQSPAWREISPPRDPEAGLQRASLSPTGVFIAMIIVLLIGGAVFLLVTRDGQHSAQAPISPSTQVAPAPSATGPPRQTFGNRQMRPRQMAFSRCQRTHFRREAQLTQFRRSPIIPL